VPVRIRYPFTDPCSLLLEGIRYLAKEGQSCDLLGLCFHRIGAHVCVSHTELNCSGMGSWVEKNVAITRERVEGSRREGNVGLICTRGGHEIPERGVSLLR